MDEKQIQFLFDNYAKNKGFSDINEFRSLMNDEGSRKVFFDDSNKELGFKDFDDFEVTIGAKKKVEDTPNKFGLGKAEIASIVTKEEPKVSQGFKPTNDEFARRKAHRDVVAQNLMNGKIPSLKEFQDKIPKYAQVNQPVSTDTNLPEEVAMQNDSMKDNTAKNEIAAQTKEEAIENTAKKILAQKGIINDYSKPLGVLQYAQLNEEKNKLKEAVENGDAVVTRKKGEAGLNRTIGWWEGLSKGWNEATKSSDEADEFVNNMDAQEKINFLAKKQEENKHPEYLGEKGNGVGSMGEFVGSNAPFLGKAVAGTILGTAATALAPETGGISTAALPTAMAFLFTAPDMVNQAAMGEIMRRYETLKRMNPDKDELALMQEAEQGKWAGGGAGLATNALLMGTGIKMPVSATGKAVIGKAITKALETSVHMGATTAAVEGVKQLEGNLEGIKSTPEDIAKSMATTFEENATVGLLLHTMTQAVNGAIKLPKALKSAIKYGLKDANPAELGEVLKMNEAQGVVPEGTAEKVVGEVEAYKKALSKTADDLPPEVQASVAGLIEAKDKIIAERETKDETQRAVYDEKIAAINEQINKTIETGKPYEHEVNELSGETYGEESKNEPQKGEPENISQPIELSAEVTPKEEVKSSTTVSSGAGSVGVGGDVETTTNVLNETQKNNPTVWQKIKDAFYSVVGKVHEGFKNTQDFIDNAINSDTPFSELAKALKDKLGDIKTSFVDDLRNKEGKLAYGKHNKDGITVSRKSPHPLQTWFHEAVHKLTVDKLYDYEEGSLHKLSDKDIEAIQNLHRIFGKVQKIINDKGIETKQYNPFKNVREFVAEALTNPEFQDILNKFKGEGKSPTLLKQFLDAVSKLLGLKDGSILDDVFHHTENLFNEGKSEQKNIAESYHDAKSKGIENDFTKAVEQSIPKETAASTVPVDNNMEKVNRLIFDRETGQPLDGSDETMAEQLIEKAISKSKDTDQANAKLDQLGYNLRGQANADFNQFVQDRIDGKTDMTFSEWKNQSENKTIQNEPIKEGAESTQPVAAETKVNAEASPVESGKSAETGESGGGKKPPVDTKDLFGDGEDAGRNKKEFDKMTSSIPNSGEVKKYLSGDTIKKYEKDKDGNDVELRNNQEIVAQELDAALRHGLDTIEKAKEVFGDDYVNKTLDYIEAENLSPENKALLYVSLENEMAKRLQADPENVGLRKLQDLVREKSQAYLRSNSLAINMGRLRKFAETGYDITKVTDRFFSPKEVEQKSAVEKLVQADAETIQKESEEQVQKMSAEGMTPEIEKLVNEGVEKEINKIYDKLPKDKKRGIDKAIAALERFQKSYKGKAYDATGAIPLAIVDAGITAIKLGLKAGAKIADAIELGVNKIKEKWGKEWEKEADFRRDMAELFKEEEKLIEPKEFTKKALIQQGFGKEINVKTKDGVEKREVLDWKKLAGEEGSVDKISANVAKSLATTAMSAEQINAMSDAFIKEYTELRASVVEKGLNEIAARNKTVVTPDQKSAAKKLAEMYNYGLFDKDLAEYQTVLAKTIGVDKLNPERLKEVIQLGDAMSKLMSSKFQGKQLTETELRTAVQRIEELMRSILNAEANEHGSTALKLADGAQTYMDLAQRMTLNSLKQAAENPLSGKLEDLFNTIGYAGSIPKVLNKDASKMARQIYKEMVLEKGSGYGNIQSTFVNRGNVEMMVDKMSDNKVVQGIMSTAIGKTTLDAVDSMFKMKITQQKFVYNLIQVLTKDRMIDGKVQKGMSKQEAQNYVAEKLTGQSFKEAQQTAKDIITNINESAGKKIFNDSPLFVDRLAHDIVTAALVNGEKISADMVKASYNAAYKAAGRGLGHVANNIVSRQVGSVTGELESRYKEQVKDKDYRSAALTRLEAMFFRNIANPFVGGGSNWVVLKAEKSGLGLLSGVASMYKYRNSSKIDLTSEAGSKNLENAMYQQMKVRDKLIRGAVGGAATALTGLALLGIVSTDKYRKWRNNNMWAAKYADLITPEILLASMAKDDGKIQKYIENSVNKNEQMDKGVKAIKVAKSAITGDKKTAAQTGELLGSTIGSPVPWRLVRDGDQLWTGIAGGEPYKVNSDKPETFVQGYLKAGMLDYMGYAPHPENKWFNDDDMKSKSFVIIKEKGLELPKEGSIKQYKVDIDDNHPEGIMTQEEYDKFTEKRRDYIKEGIDEIMNKTYEVTEEAKSGKTISYKKLKGRDLEKDLLKEKIDGVSAEATKKAKEDLGLTSKKNKKLVEEF